MSPFQNQKAFLQKFFISSSVTFSEAFKVLFSENHQFWLILFWITKKTICAFFEEAVLHLSFVQRHQQHLRGHHRHQQQMKTKMNELVTLKWKITSDVFLINYSPWDPINLWIIFYRIRPFLVIRIFLKKIHQKTTWGSTNFYSSKILITMSRWKKLVIVI